VSKDTIVNCWRKSCLIDCKETREEVENLIEKEKSKYTTELEEELKLIGLIRINEYFKKITLNPGADYFKKN
jgi:Mg/Co/Ni transporter MgtE